MAFNLICCFSQHKWKGWEYETSTSCKQVRGCQRCGEKDYGGVKHKWGEWTPSDSCPQTTRICTRCSTEETQNVSTLIAERKWEKCVEIGNYAVGPLICTLQDSNEEVRKEAAQALGKIKDARAVEPLITLLKKSRNEDTRRSAADALKRLYQNGRLTENHKQSIIALKGEIISHQDIPYSSHNDFHNDCAGSGAGGGYHEDSGPIEHIDNPEIFEI
jgi:hypothetical protein